MVIEEDQIVEIHVLADNTRSPKQLVRDIESMLKVKFDLELNHKCISVVQLPGEDVVPQKGDSRIKLQKIGYTISDGKASVFITLQRKEECYEATVSSYHIQENRMHLAAKATLTAVEDYAGIEEKFQVVEVQKVNIANQEAALVMVAFNTKGGKEFLLGTSFNRTDDLEASARATLDAVNRKLLFINGKNHD